MLPARRPNRLRLVAAGALLACLSLPASSPGPVSAADDVAVVRITSRVAPATLTVAAGTSVVFRNEDADRHRLRARTNPNEFDTGNLEPGESFAVTLTLPGTYAYVDERDRDDTAYHGTITVSGSSGAGPAPDGPGAGGEPGDAPLQARVSMAGERFTPPAVTVAAGGMVSFVNDDDREHTATGEGFDSGILAPGASHDQVFEQPGIYLYSCLIHPDMTGTVEVATAGGSAGSPDASGVPAASSPGPSAAPTASPDDAAAPDPLPSPSSQPGAVTVSLVDFEIVPAELTVAAGTSVTFRNDGDAVHTATALDQAFDTGLLEPGAGFVQAFDDPGTYDYVCLLHPGMAATITVTAISSGSSPPAASPASPGGALSLAP